MVVTVKPEVYPTWGWPRGSEARGVPHLLPGAVYRIRYTDSVPQLAGRVMLEVVRIRIPKRGG